MAVYSLTKLFLKRNDGLLVVYDIVNKSEQKLIAPFLKQLHECANSASVVREVKTLLYRVLEEMIIVCPDKLCHETLGFKNIKLDTCNPDYLFLVP